MATEEFMLNDDGIFTLDNELSAIHFSIPSGIFKGSDLIAAGALAHEVDGMIRLSVEQSLYIISNKENYLSVKCSKLFNQYQTYQNIYFNHQIACAGTATCSFGVIPNKPDAIEMANFLSKEVPIKNGKIRMYWSACPKGCGIHGVADIGFEGCKAKDEDGNSVDGVHIYIGGKATKEVKEARLYAKAVPLTRAKYIVKDLVEKYRDERVENESFEDFESRVEIIYNDQ
jgi:ferredoxin-nitrite reductase